MITRLVLENWRSHESSTLEFGKGTNVIVGPMGSGKSSAMDAISFALFGTFPNLQQRKVKLDDMIMNKPERKGYSKVSLSFRSGDQEYVIKRELTRGKGQTAAEIRLGDALMESASQRVNEKIEEILRINYDLFSRAVYAEQNNIDYFLEIPKGKRRERIDELLKIDRFESARKNLGTVMTRVMDRINDKQADIARGADTGELTELEKSLDMDTKEIEKKEASLLAGKKEKDAAELNYNEIMKKKKEFSEHDRRIKEGHGRIKLLQEKIAQYGDVPYSKEVLKAKIQEKMDERKDLKGKKERKSRLETELKNIIERLAGREKQLTEFDRKLQDMRYDEKAPEKLKQCREHLESTRRALEEAVNQYNTSETRLAEIMESVEKLKKGAERCPTCDSELNEQTISKLLQKRAGEREKYESLRTETTAKKSDLRGAHEKLEKEAEGLQKAVSSLEDGGWINKEKAKILKEMVADKENMGIIKSTVESIKLDKTDDEVEKEIDALKDILGYFAHGDELKEKTAEVEKLEAELKKMGYNEAEEKHLYDKFKDVEKQVAVLQKECTSISALIAEKKKRLGGLKKIIEDAEKSKKEVEYLNSSLESFSILQMALKDVQGKLREEFTEETNAALGDVWMRLYPYADYMGLRLAVDSSGDYILQLKRRDGGWINVEGVTSGGERSTACLALRIALSLVLTQNLSWLVLDEPTHNLDRRAIKELAGTLREHLPKIVDQVFIITHEEELESAASGALYRLDRNKEDDEPTKIVVE